LKQYDYTIKNHLLDKRMDSHGKQIPGSRQIREDETFRFDCHTGLSCFTRCCRDADMYLYPYDIVRMKNHLGISSDEFIENHTVVAFRDNPNFPNVMLRMSDKEDSACPFLSQKGCTIYEDRPFSCRAYPMERAVARTDNKEIREAIHLIAFHPYCLGHKESREWTIRKWTENQKIETYIVMNDLWVDIDTILRTNPWGTQGINSKAFRMVFMACFNIDRLKAFIVESSFLSRFDVGEEKINKIMNSDVDLLKFGFEWIRFILTNAGPLRLKRY
jgi:Fe-S-cluster containining protein